MNADDRQEPDLTNRALYKSWVSHTIRFGDLDPLGHVNNAVYSTFFEAGRAPLMRSIFGQYGDGRLDIVLANIIIDYRRELTYPGSVDIGSAIKRIGRTSVVFVGGIFKHDSTCCAATAEARLVFFDLVERKSAVPPQVVRAELEKMLID